MRHLQVIARQMKMRDAMLFGGYALYLVFSFMAFHSATLTDAVSAAGHEGNVLFVSSAMIARIALCAVVALGVWRLGCRAVLPRRGIEVSLAAGGLASGLAGFLVLAMMASVSATTAPEVVVAWLAVAGALIGCGDVLVTLLWARFSATLDLRQVYLYVIFCNMASQGIYLVVTVAPEPAVLPVAAMLFAAAAALALAALVRRGAADEGWVFSGDALRGEVRVLWHPALGTIILCFMGGLMLQISGQQDLPLGEFQQTSLWASLLAVVALLVPALVVRKPLNLERLYAVALPLSAAGFLLLPLIWNAAGGIVNAFVQVGAMVAGIILWCMVADGAHRTRLSPVLLFSLIFLGNNVAQLAGTLVGFANAHTIRPGDVTLTAVALVSVYLLLMAALVLFRNRGVGAALGEAERGADAPDTAPAVAREEALAARCAELSDRYGFTPRERDIFLLLAQGHTMPAISERLFVSENTVKSHVKRIYQKLGIHARSELIDLVNTSAEEPLGFVARKE